MEFKIIKLYFKSPLAIMSSKNDEFIPEIFSIPSDSLKASLVASFAEGNVKQEEIDFFQKKLVISSAFPFFKEHYFFPKPITKLPISDFNLVNHKKVKQIKFFEKKIFEKIINNIEFSFDDGCQIQDGNFFASNDLNDVNEFMQFTTEERVSLANTNVFENAKNIKSDPFYINRTYFKQNSGLFFIYEGNQEKSLYSALTNLKYSGIGADKNVGNGRFEWETSSISLNAPLNSNYITILSSYIPSDSNELEILLENSSYAIKKISGFIAGSSHENMRHWSKREIFKFVEGSCFRNNKKNIGKTVNLASKDFELKAHKIYRDGHPITIPVNREL